MKSRSDSDAPSTRLPMPGSIVCAALSIWLAAQFTVEEATAQATLNPINTPRQGALLVAKRTLSDPNFSRSVVLITKHGAKGSSGLILNKVSDVPVVSALPRLDDVVAATAKLHFGGPVNIRSVTLLIQTEQDIEAAEQVIDGLYFVTSPSKLESIVEESPDNEQALVRYYAGYAGWAPGQLDAEIAADGWYLVESEAETIFSQEIDSMWHNYLEMLEGTWVLRDNAALAVVYKVSR